MFSANLLYSAELRASGKSCNKIVVLTWEIMLVCIFRSWNRPQYYTHNFIASEPFIHDLRPQLINIPTCRTTRAHFNATLEQYEILDVMPPDEYQKRVNNSATTKYSIYVQVVYKVHVQCILIRVHTYTVLSSLRIQF